MFLNRGNCKTPVLQETGTDYAIRVFADFNNISNHIPVNTAIGIGTNNNGTVTVNLTVPADNWGISTTPWTGSGEYYIYLLLKTDGVWNTNYAWIYCGSGSQPVKYRINTATTTLKAQHFQKKNVWVQ